MIISASRRTDIPAFYTPWLMNRLRAGWCLVPNPLRPSQVSEVSLKPEDVDAIVFWTRNPRPLLPHLQELEDRGYRFYFLYTLMENPRVIDPGCPPLKSALKTFLALAARIGPEKVIWRYDPLLITSEMGPDFHRRAFRRIAGELYGATNRCILSKVHVYRKVEKRFRSKGIEIEDTDEGVLRGLMEFISEEARGRGMEIQSCAQANESEFRGVKHGKCVDDEYIEKVFGIQVNHRKDPSQREACRCVKSKDIGMYDTCLYGCLYCYGTGDFDKAGENYRSHDPAKPSLV